MDLVFRGIFILIELIVVVNMFFIFICGELLCKQTA